MSKRWFLTAPAYAITNYAAVRSAAIAAGVTLVDIGWKMDGEVEAAGKPALTLDPSYTPGQYNGVSFAPTRWGQIEMARKLLQQKYQRDIQTAVENGTTPIPVMPTTEELWNEAKALFDAPPTSPEGQY